MTVIMMFYYCMYVFIDIFTELWGAGFESFSKQLTYKCVAHERL